MSKTGVAAAPEGLYLEEIYFDDGFNVEQHLYKVRIDKFEGPFDLLVYLIQNAKMDIYDIRIRKAKNHRQYIGYLKEMGELNVEVSSEFIVLKPY